MCLLEQQLKDEETTISQGSSWEGKREIFIATYDKRKAIKKKKPINLGNQIWEGGQFPRPFWGVARSHASARGVPSPARSLEARFARHNRPL